LIPLNRHFFFFKDYEHENDQKKKKKVAILEDILVQMGQVNQVFTLLEVNG
jgi:hypothetical protein